MIARRLIIASAFALFLAESGHAGGLLPSSVEEFDPGTGAGFGQSLFPANVLTGPDGGVNPPSEPNDSESNLLSLGNGGSIILEWSGDAILDGAGADFTIFENVLLTLSTNVPFIETAIVEVGQSPETMVRFPFRFEPPDGWNESKPYAIPFFDEDYFGLAGTRPTYVTTGGSIDPADPLTSGGNAFDLATVGLSWARYVRIIDIGAPGSPSEQTGSNGIKVYDTFPPGSGFDLDTVVAIHFGPTPSSSTNWALYD